MIINWAGSPKGFNLSHTAPLKCESAGETESCVGRGLPDKSNKNKSVSLPCVSGNPYNKPFIRFV
jgi:hypothetical protein